MKIFLKKGFIIALPFILALLSGCSNQDEFDNRLIKSNFIMDEISYIDIEKDIYKKTIINTDELKSLVSQLQEIESESNSAINIEDANGQDVFRVNIIKKDEESGISISVMEGFAYYEGEWQPINEQLYDNITIFYDSSRSIEKEDKSLLNAKLERLTRSDLSMTEALQGVWLSENGSKIKFVSNNLYQGNDFEYGFRYDIKEASDYSLNISIYGIDGILISDKELSDIAVRMDATKSNMKIKKTMIGGMTYYDRLIYVDEEDNSLGNLDNSFFLED